MGIISRRIDPFKDNKFNLRDLPQASYTVNKFFFPKPLKVCRKPRKEEDINVDNLELEIKRAFNKNNPKPRSLTKEKPLRLGLTGSWINNTLKKKDKADKSSDRLEKENKVSAGLGVPEEVKKLGATSYSRFLSSGMVFQVNPSSTSWIKIWLFLRVYFQIIIIQTFMSDLIFEIIGLWICIFIILFKLHSINLTVFITHFWASKFIIRDL